MDPSQPGVFYALVAVALVTGCRAADQVGPAEGGAAAPSPAQLRQSAAEMIARKPHLAAPVVYIDGQRASASAEERFATIDPSRIATVQVLTGDAAIARAGAEGRHGVIVITTKSPTQP